MKNIVFVLCSWAGEPFELQHMLSGITVTFNSEIALEEVSKTFCEKCIYDIQVILTSWWFWIKFWVLSISLSENAQTKYARRQKYKNYSSANIVFHALLFDLEHH